MYINSPKHTTLKNSLLVTGLQIRTNNKNELNPETGKIMGLWDKFLQNDALVKNIDNHSTYAYGVYSQYKSDHNGEYTLTVGINSNGIDADKDYYKVEVEPGNYLMFEANGKQPESIINTWKYIWKYFENSSAPKRKFTTDFEKFTLT